MSWGRIVETALIVSLLLFGCAEQETIDTDKMSGKTIAAASQAKVTFIELGSVNCIPCKQMQPVMQAIKRAYGDQINIIFYDVWQPSEKHYARQYGIKLIPTQVFLDAEGDEFFRHEGFFPEAEIRELLNHQGLNPLKTSL